MEIDKMLSTCWSNLVIIVPKQIYGNIYTVNVATKYGSYDLSETFTYKNAKIKVMQLYKVNYNKIVKKWN